MRAITSAPSSLFGNTPGCGTFGDREFRRLSAMWRIVLLLPAFAVWGCTGADVVSDPGSGAATIIVLPTDVIESRATVWQDAAETANGVCPAGWTLRSAMDLPSDVMWEINCTHPVAGEVVKPAP